MSQKNYNLSANEGFVIILTSKLITCFIDSFTSKTKCQSIAYLLNENEHIYWISDTQYGLYEQAVFKNARVILISEVGWSTQ